MTVIDPTKKWTHPMPIWASRPDSDGMISSFTIPLWLFLSLGIVILLNAVAWGVIGLVVAVQQVL